LEGRNKPIIMKKIPIIILIFCSLHSFSQKILYRAQTLPARILLKTPAGQLKTITGYAVMAPDTAMNRIHNIPYNDSIPHFIFPAAFLNARRKPVTGIVINFDYILKLK